VTSLLVNPDHYLLSPVAIPTFITACALLVLGLVVLSRERPSPVPRLFFIMTLTVSVWFFAFSWMYCATNERVALWWAKAAYLGVPFIAAAVHHFTVAVLGLSAGYRSRVRAAWVLSGVCAAVALGTDALVAGLYRYPWGYYPRYGWFGAVFVSFFFLLMIASAVLFWKEYRRALPGRRKDRVKWFLCAMGVAFLGSVDYLAKFGVPLYPFGYVAVFGWLVFVERAIWRYQLVEITRAFAADEIFATMSDAMLVFDQEGTVRIVNQAACDLFKKPEAELVGCPVWSINAGFFPRERLERLLQIGTPLRSLTSEVRQTDSRRDEAVVLDLSASLIRDRAGHVAAVVCIARDVTAQRRAEESLRQSQELLRSAFDHAAIGMALVAPDGRWLRVNHALCDIVGYSEQELLATNFQAITHPDDLAADLDFVRQMLAGEIQTYQMEKRYFHKIGHVVWILLSVSLVRDLEGSPLFFIGQIQDITARKRAEAEHRLLLESTDEGIFGLGMDGRCTFVNASAAAMLGYTPGEVVGQDMHALLHHSHADGSPYPAEACPILRVLRTGQGHRSDREVFWRRDGTAIPAEYSAYPIREKDTVRGAVITFTDIGDRKTLEEEVRQAHKMEAVGKLAGGIAHDFNNLLLVINGYAQLCLSRVAADDPLRQDIEQVRRAGDRAAELTQQLLAFSRRQVLRPKVLSLRTVADSLGSILQRVLGEDVDLAIAVDPELGSVKADSGQLEQVLLNLTVNARDAMPQGGKLTIEIQNVVLEDSGRLTQTIPPGPYILLAVSDTGCGMSAETQARIFEPFFTTKDVDQGTGLGLSMVYGIVKQNGGHIGVYSEPGHGTTFKIYLPRVDDAVDPAEPTPPSSVLPRGMETILLVEDEPQVRTLIRDTLQGHGYRVLEARHGVEALVMAANHPDPIHLLVTDVVMPQVSGPQVAQRLAQARPDMKVLYMSGYAENAVIHHGVLDPGAAFLNKPFSLDVLAGKVREVLHSAR
jgi:two-component system cell cycle sensor histidine kinase/response regulator CckA